MIILEKSERTGSIFIDAILSKIYPDRIALLEMLERFEDGRYDNYDLGDLTELLVRSMSDYYKKIIGASKDCFVNLVYYDDPLHDPTKYRNILDWDVIELLVFVNNHSKPLFPSEVSYIREFLNTPAGQELEAIKKWQAYWQGVDFDERAKLPKEAFAPVIKQERAVAEETKAEPGAFRIS